jgi:uncharacterized membrane protein YidH (DUF202 family)
MHLSTDTWKAIALVLLVFAFGWAILGFLLYPGTKGGPLPGEPDVNFEITRGCFFGPALAVLMLAYLAYHTGRQERGTLPWPQVASALGIAMGLVLAILGLAVVLEPARANPPATRSAFATCLVLPGVILMALAGIFWWWKRRGDPA